MAQPKSKRKLIGNILAWITGSFVVLLVALQIYGQVTKRSNYGVPRYGKYQIFVVLTDSMEPNYRVDEALFVEQVKDFSTLRASESIYSQDGDAITFINRYGMIVTHRIIEIETDANGEYTFYAFGDNFYADTCAENSEGVKYCDPEDWTRHRDVVHQSKVLGKVVGQNFAFGKMYKVMSQTYFVLLFAIVPLFFVFFSSIVDLFKELKPEREARQAEEEAHDALMYEVEKAKEAEKLKLYIEMEKEKMIEDLKKESDGENDG